MFVLCCARAVLGNGGPPLESIGGDNTQISMRSGGGSSNDHRTNKQTNKQFKLIENILTANSIEAIFLFTAQHSREQERDSRQTKQTIPGLPVYNVLKGGGSEFFLILQKLMNQSCPVG